MSIVKTNHLAMSIAIAIAIINMNDYNIVKTNHLTSTCGYTHLQLNLRLQMML